MERQEGAGPTDESEPEFDDRTDDESLSGEDSSEDSSEETPEETSLEKSEDSRGESEGHETGPPRRRRRRRRRPGDRGPKREEPADVPLSAAEADDAFPAESSLELSADDEDDEDDGVEAEADAESEGDGEGDEESPRVYRNVPTWEEAIGFLLHRRPGDSGGPREFRRDGGRRPDRGERPRD